MMDFKIKNTNKIRVVVFGKPPPVVEILIAEDSLDLSIFRSCVPFSHDTTEYQNFFCLMASRFGRVHLFFFIFHRNTKHGAVFAVLLS